jgi:hypothetical protein
MVINPPGDAIDPRLLGGLMVTVTDALAETAPTAAFTLPVPGVEPAVNVVDAPVAGENDAPGSVLDQTAPETPTGLPNWSAPVAAKVFFAPVTSVADAGATAIEASVPAVTVSLWVDVVIPGDVADNVGLPAVVSM